MSEFLTFHVVWRRMLLALLLLAAGPLAAADGEVIMVIGKVEVRETAGGDWKPVKAQQPLPPGASIRTGEASQAALLLKDQTQIRVNQQSTIDFKALDNQPETSIDLLQGRIWAQVKRALYKVTAAVSPTRPVKVVSPTATIGIRGTDWDVEVGADGKTTVTVLSGAVEMSNEFGKVSIGPDEQAIAEKGKPPVKRLITDARDRVQWVTSYRPAPRRWLPSIPDALLPAVQAIEAGDYAAGLRYLEGDGRASVAAKLLLADLYLFLGRANDAIALLAPLSKSGEAMAIALHGRAVTVAGRLDEARELLLAGVSSHPGQIEIALALADVARLQGNAEEALGLFAEVTARQPDSHEAWFGVGRIENERERIKRARAALDTALTLAPDAAGYHGERATLEALAGDYAAARKAFAEALRLQPDDYLAWTGLGILQLKTGETEAALESFLKAGVLEPRFARGQLYAGVAYYRLDNAYRAIEAVKRAAELDPKDPLPYVMLGLIHGDALELRAATDAAREAQARMPFLKSLNQVLNNQKGSANVGSALAAQGMEEWARAYAFASYNPFWAGSALFLSDRYADGFNKNTELYKGFLLDPTVFGASNRSSSLVPTPGHYGSIAYIGGAADFSQNAIQLKANGLTATDIPFAYSLTGEYADGHDAHGQNAFQATGSNVTVGLGAKPAYDIGLFYFGTATDVDGHFSDPAVLPDANLSVKVSRHDLGIGYRIDSTNRIWFKLGDGTQTTRLAGTLVDAANGNGFDILVPPLYDGNPNGRLDRNDVDVDQTDVQFRHTFEVSKSLRFTWGYEDTRDKLELARMQTHPVAAVGAGFLNCLILYNPATGGPALGSAGCSPVGVLHTDVDRDLRSEGIYLSGVHQVNERVDLQLDLNYQRTRATSSAIQAGEILDRRPGGGADILPRGAPGTVTVINERDSFNELNHRVGLRFSPADGADLRLAYQRWRRPFGAGSLGLTETVGIPIEDRLVDAGGLLRRTKLRFDWEIGKTSFLQFSADHRRINNIESAAAAFFREFGLTELAALRARKPVFDQPFDELEKTPVFGEGRVSSGGPAFNWLPTDKVSVAARYLLSTSRNTGAAFDGRDVPLIPRHFANLSAFWQLGDRWLLGAATSYRSSRYADEANAQRLDAGWNSELRMYWESTDKRWTVEGAARNLHSNKASALENRARLELNSTYRF